MSSSHITARKKGFFYFITILGIVSSLFATYWYFVLSRYVATDNAYVGAEIASVTSYVSGIVDEISVTDTNIVKKGDTLIKLNQDDYDVALRQADAELESANAHCDRTKAIYERRKALSKADVSAISTEELMNAENDYKKAQAAVKLVKARFDQAKVNYSRLIIKSPINGVVSKRQVQLGQRVEPGTPLLYVVPMHDLHVDANFKEVELRHLKKGQKVTLISDKYGSSVVYQGVVEGFSGGTGSAFAIIPAQNATGNWLKVVQRLPVRITLDKTMLLQYPLEVGLSMFAKVELVSTLP